MQYDIAAKPTRYNGINFRSRLEARWAAFFDLVGWDYVYEPSEIAGYNPDFILRCSSEAYPTKVCLVEVKPLVFWTEELMQSVHKKYQDLRCHLLILCDMPFWTNSQSIVIGKGAQYYGSPEYGFFFTELIDIEMKSGDDFGSTYMAFDGMICGKIDREIFADREDLAQLKLQWNTAGNKVQFKIKKKKRG